jgi:hypothetical protein
VGHHCFVENRICGEVEFLYPRERSSRRLVMPSSKSRVSREGLAKKTGISTFLEIKHGGQVMKDNNISVGCRWVGSMNQHWSFLTLDICSFLDANFVASSLFLLDSIAWRKNCCQVKSCYHFTQSFIHDFRMILRFQVGAPVHGESASNIQETGIILRIHGCDGHLAND